MNHEGHQNGVGPTWVVKYKLWPQGPLVGPANIHDEIYHHQLLSQKDADYKFLSDSKLAVQKHNKNKMFWLTFVYTNHLLLRLFGWFMYNKLGRRSVAYVKKLFKKG